MSAGHFAFSGLKVGRAGTRGVLSGQNVGHTAVTAGVLVNPDDFLCLQVEDYEEEPLLKTGCKEYFWLLCKLIDNIHVKDASQVSRLTSDPGSAHTLQICRVVGPLLVSVCLNSQKVSPSLSLAGSVQTTLLDLDALARHLADCIRRSESRSLRFRLCLCVYVCPS